MARRRRRGRDVHGVLLLDKPVGISSNDALQIAKRLFDARKAGHTGSLDKLASGLLPLCFGEATKVSGFLLNADKHYLATFKLGEVTRTGDREGEVIAVREVPDLSENDLDEAMGRFAGPISQVPPMHSAIKYQGQPLYRLAHQGIEVERKPRQVTIHQFVRRGFHGDLLEVEVRCSKGTYIRTLAEDLGEVLGCGAHVSALRRIGSGPYEQPEMLTLDDLRDRLEAEGQGALDDLLLPMESAVSDWPRLRLSEDLVYYVLQGQPVMVPQAPTSGWVRLYTREGRFFAVGEVLDDGLIAPRRVLHTGAGVPAANT